MDGDVSKGSIHVIVENKNKETILDLTPEIKTGMLTVDEKCRYYLMLKFEKQMARLSYNGISGYIVYKIITFQIEIDKGVELI